MKLFRLYKDKLQDSLEHVYTVESLQDVLEICKSNPLFFNSSINDVSIKPIGFDERTLWFTFVITIRGYTVGFSNGELK